MSYVTHCHILYSTSLKSTFILFDTTQLLRVVFDSDEELDDQMISENVGGIQNEGESLTQMCFIDAIDEELA